MGHIYLYTGLGGGKTTNALGLALRTVGHRRHVVIIQFMKWWKNTGEYKIKKTLAPYYEIYQFGRKGWHGLKNLNEEDRKLAKNALKFARQIMIAKKPHLLVLDEINLALYCKLLSIDDVLAFLDLVPRRTQVVLTGRYAPKELINRADFVNEVVLVKSPDKIPTTKGIQY
ncbi:MAG: cob(I)yrinic acid a,c-diamide adenosyltransferase [Candidatus Bathyarchaeales archaeon]